MDASFLNAVLRDLSDEEGRYRSEFCRVTFRVNADCGNAIFFFLAVNATACDDLRFRFYAVRPFLM